MRTFSDYAEITGKLHKFKLSGDTKGKACCPGHEDRHPSMTLAIGDDGRLLVNCKAGCTFQRICEGLGVSPAVFFPPGERVGTRGDPTTRSQIVNLFSYDRLGPDGAEVETVCQVVKLLTRSGTVQTRVRTPNPRFRANEPAGDNNQEWLWSAQHPPCLYRYADIDRKRRVFLVDTEEDANALWQRGLQGTTVPLGLAAMTAQAAGLLAGSHVTVIADGDAYGGEGDKTQHANLAKSAAKLLLGKAASVSVCFLPDAPRGAGFGSWFAYHTFERDDDQILQLFRETVTKYTPVTSLAGVDALMPPIATLTVDMLALVDECAKNLTQERKNQLAELLGVPSSALDAIDGLGFDPKQHCWTFPERGTQCQILGASRRWSNGSKANIDASRRGLTLPLAKDVIENDTRPILILEGASDVVAATHAGLRCIGRPSNTGGAALLLGLLGTYPAGTEVIVFGENDKRTKEDGKVEHPGLDGAQKILADLAPLADKGIKLSILMPPEGFKDARSFLTARTESWDQRGKVFLQRCGHVGPAATVAEIKKPIIDRVAELVNFYRRQPPKTDVNKAAADYDELSLRIAGKVEAGDHETETRLVEICAELIYRHEAAVQARRNR